MKPERQVVERTPREVRCLETVWIPMSDGSRLAARVWLPEDAARRPVPAVLEYIPYRRRDFTRTRDSLMHPYIAGHGYACLRVDLRGSGDSDGVLRDEYLQQELDDGAEVLRWIASQPWCTGDVGMIGISWGGFNGLQIAAMQPPELKAVITACSTDDRYADDIHHMGGCLLGDNLSWASVMFAYNSLPPDPEVVGERWRDMWRERLEGSGLWISKWLRHQTRDEYWSHGSVCENFSAIRCPVFAVSGWADGYSNAVFRLLEKLDVPRRGLIGPWSHKYPHLGVPGPAIDFLHECLRWWDQWLKGIETGVREEPLLRVWMQDSVPPTTSYVVRPGRWIAEPCWPSPHVRSDRYALSASRLIPDGECPDQSPLTIQSPLTVGLFAGKWCSYAAGPDLAHDQRQEDGGALLFDSEPLESPIEILGAPTVTLDVSSNQPVAMLAARLSDLAVDDKATRITYGLLNLTHRDGSERPSYLEPGKRYRVTIPLNHIAQSFPAGHRLRLAISTSYWPLAWAPPKPVRVTIHPHGSHLDLPLRDPRPDDDALRPFGPPTGSPAEPRGRIEPDHHNWLVHRDLATDESTLEVINDQGVYSLESIDLTIANRVVEKYICRANDFTSLRGEVRSIRQLRRGDWQIRSETRTILTCTESEFHVQADLDAYEGDKRVACKSWDDRIPRSFL